VVLDFPSRGTTGDPHEAVHLRDRVRLYLQVLLLIDVGAYVSDYVSPLLIADLTMPDHPRPVLLLRWSVTLVMAITWAVARFARPGRRTMIAVEAGITMGLSVVYVMLATAHTSGVPGHYGPIFALTGIMLLLAVRAALVPSPVIRTAMVGAVAMGALLLMGRRSIEALDPLVVDGLTFMAGAFIVVSSVTSRVIYGLRREVRAALRLGQYTLAGTLGEGGMGTVYRARHAMLRREAAIKLIRPELIGDDGGRETAIQRFEREAQITATLTSPHTVELYDFGVSDDGAFYYVMELLDGITLEDAVRRFGPMPPARVVAILRQVCDSLAEAHAAGLVHRDVKPANIFLSRRGLRHDVAKVLDFGLVALGADRTADDPGLTAEGIAAGTPAYLAPELATRPDAVDGRADLYALGAVGFWLLTGRPPFERETAMATILAHVNDPPHAPSSVSELDVPEALDALILACLAKDPRDRPPTASALATRLDRALDGDRWTEADAKRWWSAHLPDPRPPAAEAGDVEEAQATVQITRMVR